MVLTKKRPHVAIHDGKIAPPPLLQWTLWMPLDALDAFWGRRYQHCCYVMIIVDDFSKDECPFPLFPCSKDDQFRWTYATRSHKQTQKTREKVQVISRSQLLQTDRWFCQSDKNQFFPSSESQNPFRIWQFFLKHQFFKSNMKSFALCIDGKA